MTDDEREYHIVCKLPYRGRYVRTQEIRRRAVGIFSESETDARIDEVVDERRDDKRESASRKHVPGTAESVVERDVYALASLLDERLAPRAGNDTAEEHYQAEHEVDRYREYRELSSRLWSEMLGHDIHSEKSEPRNYNSAIEREPVYGQIYALVGEKIHCENADNEKDCHCRRHAVEKKSEFRKRVFYSFKHISSFQNATKQKRRIMRPSFSLVLFIDRMVTNCLCYLQTKFSIKQKFCQAQNCPLRTFVGEGGFYTKAAITAPDNTSYPDTIRTLGS